MKVYLVGGAVRDQLLGRPIHEKDYVVVGASPEQMLAQGYKQVGKDFPVFLHPDTQEEYALARTERKSGAGYYGFSVYAAPDVTLEQDLQRRDLTINAMAQDADGNIIDPFNGQQDLQQKYLRHVSNAFAEDPVRVLRVARFAARYAHLGFRVHPETLQLMRAMVRDGEVNHLVAERVWKECEKTLSEKKPDVFFQVLRECGALAILFPEIDALFGVPNPPEWHPEIDSGIHTMMVLQQAVSLTNSKAVRFAALTHDLGKALTDVNDWPSHPAHGARGVKPIIALCERLRIPKEYRDLAILVSRYHIEVHRCKKLRPGTLVKMFNAIDAHRRPQRFKDFLLACEADAKGRTGYENNDYPQKDFLLQAFNIIKQINVQDIIKKGFTGEKIREQLTQRQVEAINDWLNSK